MTRDKPLGLGFVAGSVTLVVFCFGCGGGSPSSSGSGGGGGGGGGGSITSPPAQSKDVTPINGGAFYLVNQHSGLQADPNSPAAGDHVVLQTRSFTSPSQRWAFTSLGAGKWKVSDLSSGLCLDNASNMGSTWVVVNPCSSSSAQQWTLTPTSNGYYTIANANNGLLVDVMAGGAAAGVWLQETPLSGSPVQSQQWLLRPAFFRGVDNALLEKQESAHSSNGVPWWNDAGQAQDVLAILKNHGINMIRLRPSSAPPYLSPSQTGCAGNLCYAETDTQDLDLAKRARNLGMSLELTLLFDGGSSRSLPSTWANESLSQLQTDVYNYVKQELMAYRQAGVMPDLVAIGNEVDTGFLGSSNSPTGANFGNFATLEKQGLQAVADAAADRSIGPPIPPPLTCIHITPAWDLTNFFTLVNQNGVSYDAICQSYYPMFHGPLTDTQAAVANPGGKAVEQDVLNNAATNLGKPIFVIEAGEHYENGFQSNDPWYAPNKSAQRQFLIDLDAVVKALPNNLGMGIEYWDATGVNVPTSSGGNVNGDNKPDAIYVWNGLGLFDDSDGGTGTTNASAASYSAVLPGIDALGGKLDSTLSYKFVNRSNGQILGVTQGSNVSGAQLSTGPDNGSPGISQQWRVTSNQDGFFRIANLNPGPGATVNVLDDLGASSASGNPIVQATANGSQEQEWDVVSAGAGYFHLSNRVSGLVLDLSGSGMAVQQSPNSSSQTQQWQIVPVQ